MSLSRREISWFDSVEKMARGHDSFGQYSIVAAAIKGNRILGVGYNYYPNRQSGAVHSPLYAGMGTHAELACLSSEPVTGTTLFIAGCVVDSKYPICSKPCCRCNNLLINSSVRAIVYRDKDMGLIKVKPSALSYVIPRELNKR